MIGDTKFFLLICFFTNTTLVNLFNVQGLTGFKTSESMIKTSVKSCFSHLNSNY